MRKVESVDALRRSVADWRRGGKVVGFVPTMGNLHEGHLKLVREALDRADKVVVSIFVNPLQFGPSEDFASYPRTLEADAAMLERAGTDLLFAPSVDTVYAGSQAEQTRVVVPGLSDILCGESRPGHFSGVATVVCKLLNMVQPDLAVFGEKDYQQLLVIRRMVRDLCLSTEIVGVATVREPDGVAMSSRNGYLNATERTRASTLFLTLEWVAGEIRSGERGYADLESLAEKRLEEAGFRPDYVGIRRADDLGLPSVDDSELVVLGAAYLGRARLIDNLRV